ncbi:hypothetical protein DMN91_012874 [Ooceraea biroi]|uniref:Uncharacterized protein n=1 Tax=Ooceraea biroi TaxID=2015173 RepID=A0A3L8D3A1_OOCBI|nr:MATH and LRR domain-containing protein PFE0570w [Ooceraea biroi]RLU14987.1 hypothetical protein DMN91_012874 [Ooceraea biroi]
MSHEAITWITVDNNVTDRMIDNSFIHKVRWSQIRKRTKILNAELKRHGVKNYKQYVHLKTTLLRDMAEDTDTDNIDLSDVDYDVIHSTPAARTKYIAKYKTENLNKYILNSEEDFQPVKRKKSVKRKSKSSQTSDKSKPSRTESKEPSKSQSPKKHANICWKIIKNNKDTSYTFHTATQASASNDEENLFKDENHDYLEARSNNRSLTLFNMKSRGGRTRKNDENCNVVVDELCSPNDGIFNKKKPVVENGPQNYTAQDASLNKSNIESRRSHNNMHLSKSTNLESSYNTSDIVLKWEDSFTNELTEISNEDLINTKNFSNKRMTRKSSQVESVRKNLISVLEEMDSTRNDKDGVKKNKSVKDQSNCDQSPPAVISFSRSSAPLKTSQINVTDVQGSLSSVLLPNQRKCPTNDEDLESRLVENEQSNLKSPTSFLADIAEEILTSPRTNKKITAQKEVKAVKLGNSKQDMKEKHTRCHDSGLEDSGEENSKEAGTFSDEMRNSSRLDQNDKDARQMKPVTQEDKTEEDTDFVKSKSPRNIEIRLSSEESCIKDRHSKSYDDIVKGQESKEMRKSPKKINNSSKLNKDKDAESKRHSTKSEESYDSQEQRLLSPRRSPTRSKCTKSHDNNNLGMQNGRKVSESSLEEEVKDPLRSNEVDKNAEIYSVNNSHKDETDFVKSEDSPKQQSLPKITCTELINKKYKIINKNSNDVDSNIKKTDNVDNNIDIISADVPIKNATLIACSPAINDDADSWPKKMANTGEINNDVSMTLETDEEDNTTYLSPQSKKRLQQQATLNLIVYSESSESDDENNVTIERPKRRIDSSDESHSSEDDTPKNDETTYASKENDINGSRSKDSDEDTSSEETTPVSEEINKSNSTGIMQERMKKKTVSPAKLTSEDNFLKSNGDENSLEKTQNCGNVYNDESSLLDKENIYNKNKQRDRVSDCTDKFENKSGYKSQSTSISTRTSHVESDASAHRRPRNLQQLVEDENLRVETASPSFTIADLSEDEEAFILNVPSKVLQCSLQDQLFILKNKTIKFGQTKYVITHTEMHTTSCIFATGKARKPYKTVNIKNVGVVTARERLSFEGHLRKSNSLNFNNTDTSFELKSPKISNGKINDTESKISENYSKYKRRRGSDSNSEQSPTKRKRLKVYS